MAFRHGKDTKVKLGGTDISTFTNSTDFNNEADAVETTTYGNDSKTYIPGLKDGKITCKGSYDDTAGGPRAMIRPMLGTTQPFIFQPEGTGTGKRQTSVSVVVTAFNESSPVAEVIQWTCEMQMTGTPNDAPQA